MKSKNFLIVFAILVIAMSILSCVGATGPTPPPPPPPPDESKYYDLEVEYIRTEILNPDRVNCALGVSLENPMGGNVLLLFTQIDTTHYKGEFQHVKGGIVGYHFHTIDVARLDGTDESSAVVGDKFIITVKQTGVAVELKDIRPDNLPSNPYQGPQAMAAWFDLSSDGTISSNPK